MLERIALALTAWAERWIPDAFVFALGATLLVFVYGLGIGVGPGELVRAWGDGFWDLLGFTMQMALVIITGHVVASSPPVRRLTGRIASLSIAGHPKGAVALVALFSMVTSWFNWGFSLIFSAILAREIAKRKRGVDYRALAAATLLGLGSVWAQGLSGSAALQMATANALPKHIRDIIALGDGPKDGVIGFTHTIFLWQSFVSVAIEIVVVALVMYWAAPRGSRAKDVHELGVSLEVDQIVEEIAPPKTPGEKIEHSPILSLALVAVGAVYLFFSLQKHGLRDLKLNTINLTLLLLGMLLHKTPARLMRAFRDAVPSTWGVILQFPFYAGIAAMISTTKLNESVAELFVKISTKTTFPAMMALYSALLGIFVPSGGSKWIIEAPYVMRAAHELKVHLGWVVACYDLGEALANLIQPFWMLPVLSLLGLKARDVMGYTFIIFVVLLPLVIFMTTLLGATLGYPL